MAKMDRKRLKDLKAKEKAGTLSQLERIELELLREEAAKQAKSQVEAGAWEDLEEAEVETVEHKGVTGSEQPRPTVKSPDEFEVVPVEDGTEEEEEEAPVIGKKASPSQRQVKTDNIEQEQAKSAVAFGAGAIIGYFLRDLLEDEAEPAQEDDENETEAPDPEAGSDD